MRCLADKKFRLALQLMLLRISPKICQSQPPTTYSYCFRFHPNRFTFGGENCIEAQFWCLGGQGPLIAIRMFYFQNLAKCRHLIKTVTITSHYYYDRPLYSVSKSVACLERFNRLMLFITSSKSLSRKIFYGAENRFNSAESEPIWMKSGTCWTLALVDFGRDSRSIDSLRGSRNFLLCE